MVKQKKRKSKRAAESVPYKPTKKDKLRDALCSASSEHYGDKTILKALLTVSGAKAVYKKMLSDEKKNIAEQKKDLKKREAILKKKGGTK